MSALESILNKYRFNLNLIKTFTILTERSRERLTVCFVRFSICRFYLLNERTIEHLLKILMNSKNNEYDQIIISSSCSN